MSDDNIIEQRSDFLGYFDSSKKKNKNKEKTTKDTYTPTKEIQTIKKSRNSARWMTESEITAALTPVEMSSDDDIPAAGIPLYSNGTVAYVDTSDAHNMIIGSTGSKKTRLFIMPMLETIARSGESAVVFDPKGELCSKTYGAFKKKGYRTYVLDLRNPSNGDCWNPLHIPYQLIKYGGRKNEDKGLSMIKDMAFNLIPVKSTKDPYWESSAQGLLFAMTSILMKRAENIGEVTIANVCKLKNLVFEDAKSMRRFLCTVDPDSPEYTAFSTAVNNAETTCKCISSNFDQHMWEFVASSTLSSMMSKNDIDLSSIGDTKTIVYIISPDEKKTMNAIASVFIKQLYEVLIDRANSCENGRLPVRVNFVFDEFANMPAVEGMDAIVTACRGRNIRMTIVVQGMKQLVNIYGNNAATIESNCSNIVFINGREVDYLNKLSNLAGRDDRGCALITPFGLQRLDKNLGEAFIMNDRNLPFITHMTDIDAYGLPKRPEYIPRIRKYVKPRTFNSNHVLGFDTLLDPFLRERM